MQLTVVYYTTVQSCFLTEYSILMTEQAKDSNILTLSVSEEKEGVEKS